MLLRSTKTFDIGLSCAYRQWRSPTHCRWLHGYDLKVGLVFGADTMDDNGWVMDFGGLKPVKAWLEQQFDHKTLVAGDDPELARFLALHHAGVADVMVWPGGVGCERFASMIYHWVGGWLMANAHGPRVWLESCEVRERGANSTLAIRNGPSPAPSTLGGLPPKDFAAL